MKAEKKKKKIIKYSYWILHTVALPPFHAQHFQTNYFLWFCMRFHLRLVSASCNAPEFRGCRVRSVFFFFSSSRSLCTHVTHSMCIVWVCLVDDIIYFLRAVYNRSVNNRLSWNHRSTTLTLAAFTMIWRSKVHAVFLVWLLFNAQFTTRSQSPDGIRGGCVLMRILLSICVVTWNSRERREALPRRRRSGATPAAARHCEETFTLCLSVRLSVGLSPATAAGFFFLSRCHKCIQVIKRVLWHCELRAQRYVHIVQSSVCVKKTEKNKIRQRR